MKKYIIEEVRDYNGLISLHFDGSQLGINLIEGHPYLNNNAVKNLKKGDIMLIEGKKGDSLEDLCSNGIKTMLVKEGESITTLYHFKAPM
ncbi:MAG: hypothetical protein PHW96_01030 [Candidatus Nanoarchaeia archaeon]|nr:hypothetical protein [Candidatus Nanoarchaeia archaeon]